MNPIGMAAILAAASLSELLAPGFNGMFLDASEVTADGTRTRVFVLLAGAAVCLCMKRK